VNENFPHIGFLLTTYNDIELSNNVYRSLVGSMPNGAIWSFAVVDGGSEDESVNFWTGHAPVIHPGEDCALKHVMRVDPDDLKHLSVALNVGIDYLLNRGAKYIAWIHADMEFPQEGWAHNLVKRIEEDRTIGKISPNLSQQKTAEEREGNNCPWVIPAYVFDKIPEWRGYVHGDECDACPRNNVCSKIFCENYRGIGGYEDWDLNRILKEADMKVVISPVGWVVHEGMGTRAKTGKAEDTDFNANYYHRRFETWEPIV